MITVKSAREIEIMARAGRIVALADLGGGRGQGRRGIKNKIECPPAARAPCRAATPSSRWWPWAG
ncbi:MAG: hypothetical protein AABZ35_04080, partial [Gemmatimonadota bacterium]